MIPPASLTEFSEDQLKTFIRTIEEAIDENDKRWAYKVAEELQLLLVQLYNALNVVTANEKIYQS